MSVSEFQLIPLDKKFVSQLIPVRIGDKKKPGQVLWAIFVGGRLDGCVKPFVDNEAEVSSLADIAAETQAIKIEYYYQPCR